MSWQALASANVAPQVRRGGGDALKRMQRRWLGAGCARLVTVAETRHPPPSFGGAVAGMVETTEAVESTGGVLARRACGRGRAEDSHARG
jgi:hypothetical protein